jgi:hypothetical protein
MPTYHEFSQQSIDEAMALAKEHQDLHEQSLTAAGPTLEGVSQLSLAAQCIQVKIDHGRICLKIPIVGNICLPIPKIIKDGTLAEVCLHLCFWGPIPRGVKVTVSVGGKVILTKTFGSC